jgi:Protein of unknown function (DUF3592)
MVAATEDDCKVSVIDLGCQFEVKEVPKPFQNCSMRNLVHVLILLLIGVFAFLRQWPEWLRRARSANWPTTPGVVESGSVSTMRGRTSAKIGYSYGLAGTYYSGYHTEEFDDGEKAWSYVDALKGRPVQVSYNPQKPEVSVLRNQQQLS